MNKLSTEKRIQIVASLVDNLFNSRPCLQPLHVPMGRSMFTVATVANGWVVILARPPPSVKVFGVKTGFCGGIPL